MEGQMDFRNDDNNFLEVFDMNDSVYDRIVTRVKSNMDDLAYRVSEVRPVGSDLSQDEIEMVKDIGDRVGTIDRYLGFIEGHFEEFFEGSTQEAPFEEYEYLRESFATWNLAYQDILAELDDRASDVNSSPDGPGTVGDELNDLLGGEAG